MDVSLWLPITFVCVVTAVAVVGNTLVLIVYQCMWKSTNATKVYIMTLATVDLVGIVVSSPRELVPLSGRLNGRDIEKFCRIMSFFIYVPSLTSSFMLIATAVNRLVKVTKDGGEYGYPSQLRLSSPKDLFLRLFQAVSTIKGAKVVAVVSVVLSVCLAGPVLALYDPEHHDINVTCYSSCMLHASANHHVGLKVFHTIMFILWICVFTSLAVLYVAVFRRLWVNRRAGKVMRAGKTARRPMSVCYDRKSGSLGTLCDLKNNRHSTSIPLSRTMSESDTNRRLPRPETDSTRTVSNPFTKTEIGLAKSKLNQRSQTADSSSSVPTQDAEMDLASMLPPVSYSAQQIAMSQKNLEAQSSVPWHDSFTSLQLRKQGSLPKKTTLVFILVSVVFFLGYVPVFVSAMLAYSSKLDESPAPRLELELCSRAYLINYAAIPIVYAFASPHFRNALWKFLSCRRQVI